MDPRLREYFAEIGRRGGRASKRELEPEKAREMVRIREARRAYHRYYHKCFWYCTPDLIIAVDDVPWVAEQLRKYGGRKAWDAAAKLCR